MVDIDLFTPLHIPLRLLISPGVIRLHVFNHTVLVHTGRQHGLPLFCGLLRQYLFCPACRCSRGTGRGCCCGSSGRCGCFWFDQRYGRDPQDGRLSCPGGGFRCRTLCCRRRFYRCRSYRHYCWRRLTDRLRLFTGVTAGIIWPGCRGIRREKRPGKTAFSFPRFKQRTEPRIHPRIESARNKSFGNFRTRLVFEGQLHGRIRPGQRDIAGQVR